MVGSSTYIEQLESKKLDLVASRAEKAFQVLLAFQDFSFSHSSKRPNFKIQGRMVPIACTNVLYTVSRGLSYRYALMPDIRT